MLVKIGWKAAKQANAIGGDPTGALPVCVNTIQFCEDVGVPVWATVNTVMGFIAKACCFVDETPQIVLSGFPNRDAAEMSYTPQYEITGTSRQTQCEKWFSKNLGMYDFHDKNGELV